MHMQNTNIINNPDYCSVKRAFEKQTLHYLKNIRGQGSACISGMNACTALHRAQRERERADL